MSVRLPEKFYDDATEAVTGQKAPKHRARRGDFASDQPEHSKQQQAFKTGFIELRGVAAGRSAGGKHHTPGNIGGASVQLSVDEISKAAKPQADWRDGGREIGNSIDGNALTFAEPDQRDDGPDQPSMKRHAAFPHGEDFQGMLRVVGKIIEQGIPDPAADKYPQRRPDDHIVNLVFRDCQSFFTHFARNEEIRCSQSDQVHEAIPAELQRTNFEKDRAQMGIGDGLKPAHSRLMWHCGWIISDTWRQCKPGTGEASACSEAMDADFLPSLARICWFSRTTVSPPVRKRQPKISRP